MCYFQGICLISKQIKYINLLWQIVLDTGSSISIFYNPDLLKQMGTTSKPLHLITNGGELRANRMEMYHDLQLWFNSDLITNILSFSSVAEIHRIIIDTAKDKDILVEIEDGK